MMVLFAPVSVTATIYLESVEKKSIRLVPISELGAISDIEIGVSINGDEVSGRSRDGSMRSKSAPSRPPQRWSG